MKTLLIGSILFFSSFAQAGLYLEPGITYEKGDSSVAWPAPLGTSTGSSSGLGFNFKGGWAFEDVLYLGVDLDYSKPNFKNSSVDYDATATSTIYGAVVGFRLPVLGLRIWGSYIFDGILDPEPSNGYDVKFKEPKGIKAGVGIKILLISLNFEYADLQYNNSTLEQVAGVNVNTTMDEKLKNKLYIFSVSMPITL